MLAVGQRHHIVATAIAIKHATVNVHTCLLGRDAQHQIRCPSILSDHGAHLARGKRHLIGASSLDGAWKIVVAQHTERLMQYRDFLNAVWHIHPYLTRALLSLDNTSHTALKGETRLRGHHLYQGRHLAILVLHLSASHIGRKVVGQRLKIRHRQRLRRHAHPRSHHHYD